MNIKLHVLIISAIVLVLFVIWQMFIIKPAEVESLMVSGYKLKVSRASYGLSCKDFISGDEVNEGPYADVSAKERIRENNALTSVARICDGRSQCKFNVSSNVIGFDPYPTCGLKDLRVEFRCFEVDRLRRLVFKEGAEVSIDCDKIIGQ